MYKSIVFIFMLTTLLTQAQSRKPSKKPVEPPPPDTTAVAADTSVVEEEVFPQEFAVYTKKPANKKERTKLCLNLVSKDVILNYCMNDSVLRNPEVSKVLFETKKGDSTFVLVYVEAFSKPVDKPQCDAGKEVKLFFVRWHTASNKAIVKQRSIESCMKGITNMTKEPVSLWEPSSPLVVNYHRGGSDFVELRFDPQQFEKGLQVQDE